MSWWCTLMQLDAIKGTANKSNYRNSETWKRATKNQNAWNVCVVNFACLRVTKQKIQSKHRLIKANFHFHIHFCNLQNHIYFASQKANFNYYLSTKWHLNLQKHNFSKKIIMDYWPKICSRQSNITTSTLFQNIRCSFTSLSIFTEPTLYNWLFLEAHFVTTVNNALGYHLHYEDSSKKRYFLC